MRITPLALLFTLCALVPLAASAEVVRVFTLPLGGKLDRKLPRCNKPGKPNVDFCRKGRAISPKVKNKIYRVSQPQEALPEWVAPGFTTLAIGKTGKLDFIALPVLSGSETAAIVSISNRFGPPNTPSTTRSGIRLTAWRRPALSIELLCNFDECVVNFFSPAGARTRARPDFISRPVRTMP